MSTSDSFFTERVTQYKHSGVNCSHHKVVTWIIICRNNRYCSFRLMDRQERPRLKQKFLTSEIETLFFHYIKTSYTKFQIRLLWLTFFLNLSKKLGQCIIKSNEYKQLWVELTKNVAYQVVIDLGLNKDYHLQRPIRSSNKLSKHINYPNL